MLRSVHVIVAAFAVLVAIVVAYATMGAHNSSSFVSNEPVAGSSGIARPHPPLDRAPGEPLKTPL
jgi:hypothetical protein